MSAPARLILVALLALVFYGLISLGKWMTLRRTRHALSDAGWPGVDIDQHPATVVLFTGPRCTQCAAQRLVIREAIESLPEVGYAEFDASQATDLAQRASVLSVPTTIVLSRGGDVLFRNGRFVGASHLRRQLTHGEILDPHART